MDINLGIHQHTDDIVSQVAYIMYYYIMYDE